MVPKMLKKTLSVMLAVSMISSSMTPAMAAEVEPETSVSVIADTEMTATEKEAETSAASEVVLETVPETEQVSTENLADNTEMSEQTDAAFEEKETEEKDTDNTTEAATAGDSDKETETETSMAATDSEGELSTEFAEEDMTEEASVEKAYVLYIPSDIQCTYETSKEIEAGMDDFVALGYEVGEKVILKMVDTDSVEYIVKDFNGNTIQTEMEEDLLTFDMPEKDLYLYETEVEKTDAFNGIVGDFSYELRNADGSSFESGLMLSLVSLKDVNSEVSASTMESLKAGWSKLYPDTEMISEEAFAVKAEKDGEIVEPDFDLSIRMESGNAVYTEADVKVGFIDEDFEEKKADVQHSSEKTEIFFHANSKGSFDIAALGEAEELCSCGVPISTDAWQHDFGCSLFQNAVDEACTCGNIGEHVFLHDPDCEAFVKMLEAKCTCDCEDKADIVSHDHTCPVYLEYEKTFGDEELLDTYELGSDVRKIEFPLEYSYGALNLSSGSAKSTFYGYTSKYAPTEGTEVGKTFYEYANTSKKTSAYIVAENGAFYQNEALDVVIYPWTIDGAYGGMIIQQPGLSITTKRFVGYGGKSWEKAAPNRMGMEFHFYKSGHAGDSNYEVNFQGLTKFKDLDADEGWKVLNANESEFFTYGNTSNITYDKNGYAIGNSVVSTDEEMNTIGSVWLTFSATKTSPLKMAYSANTTYMSSIGVVPHTIKYQYATGSAQVVTMPASQKVPDYGTYVTPTVPTPPAGYKFAGWNTQADMKGKTVTANTMMYHTTENMTYYAMYTAETGSLSIKKNVDMKGSGVDINSIPAANRTFTFNYKGGAQNQTGTKTMTAAGTATVTDMFAGSYTITETCPTKYWNQSTTSATTTVATGGTGTVTFTNSLKVGNVKVVKTVENESDFGQKNCAGFKFRLKGTSAIGAPYTKDAVTDAAGNATFSNVPIGTYEVSEIEVPSWWDASESSTATVDVEENKTETIYMGNKFKTGNVKIQKEIELADQAQYKMPELDGYYNKSLAGFAFRLSGTSDSGDAVDVYSVTNEDGIAVFEKIPVGTKDNYTITEVSKAEVEAAATGNKYAEAVKGSVTQTLRQYVKQAPVKVSVTYNDQTGEGNTTTKTIKNLLAKWDVSVTKIDQENQDKKISGAEFGLYTSQDFVEENSSKVLLSADTLIEKAVTGEDGVARFSPTELPLGNYYIKELKAPDKYTTSKEKLQFIASYKDSADVQHISLNFSNEITKVNVKKYIAGTTTYLKNAELAVYSGTEEIDKWTTSEEGHVINGLLVGSTYVLKEISPASGYVTANDVEFTVQDRNEDGGYAPQEIIMEDEPTKIQINVYERDEKEALNPLDEVKLHLEDNDGTTYVLEGNEVKWTSKTGESGYYERVPIGEYKVVTDEVPSTFVVPEPVTISVKDTADLQVFDVIIDHTKIKVNTVDKFTKEDVPGSIITIKNEDGEPVYENVTLEFLQQYVPEGNYIITTTSVPAGYVIPEDKAITVEKIAEEQPYVIEIDHTRIKVDIIDEVTEEPIPNTIVTIKKEDGTPVYENVPLEYIQEYVPEGNYIITTVSIPEGYVIPKDFPITVEKIAEEQPFILKADHTKVKVNIEDKFTKEPVPDTIVTVKDKDGNKVFEKVPLEFVKEYLPEGEYTIVTEDIPKGYVIPEELPITVEKIGEWQDFMIEADHTRISITPIDEVTKEPITEGVIVDILDKDGNVVHQQIPLKHLEEYVPEGDYIVHVTEVPAGYVIPEDFPYTVQKISDLQEYEIPISPIKAQIKPVDPDGKDVNGVKMHLEDETGKIVGEWTSDGWKLFERIPAGKYKVVVDSVPDGYLIPDPTEIEIQSIADLQEFKIPLEKKPVEPSAGNAPAATPKTGDPFNIASSVFMITMLLALILSGGLLINFENRKRKNR